VSVAGVRPHISAPNQARLHMPLSLSWLLNGHFNGRDRGMPRDRELRLLPSMWFLCSGDHEVVSGPEGRAAGIEYETQFAREERVMRAVRPDVH